MARGWESKSVEAQIETAESGESAQQRGPLSLEQRLRLQKREGLLLARARALQDLETARNPRYRQMLQEVLDHIGHELESLVSTR